MCWHNLLSVTYIYRVRTIMNFSHRIVGGGLSISLKISSVTFRYQRVVVVSLTKIHNNKRKQKTYFESWTRCLQITLGSVSCGMEAMARRTSSASNILDRKKNILDRCCWVLGPLDSQTPAAPAKFEDRMGDTAWAESIVVGWDQVLCSSFVPTGGPPIRLGDEPGLWWTTGPNSEAFRVTAKWPGRGGGG